MKWARTLEGQREGRAPRTTPMYRRKNNIRVYVKESFGVRTGFSGWTSECGTAAKPLGSIHTAYLEFNDLLSYCQHLKRGFFLKQTVNCIFLMALLCGNRWVVTARDLWLRSLSQTWTTSWRCDNSFLKTSVVICRLNQQFLTVQAQRTPYKVSPILRNTSRQLSRSQFQRHSRLKYMCYTSSTQTFRSM